MTKAELLELTLPPLYTGWALALAVLFAASVLIGFVALVRSLLG